MSRTTTSVPGDQGRSQLYILQGMEDFHFSHHFLKFWSSFLIFRQLLPFFLISFLILAFWVGKLPTREGCGYDTAGDQIKAWHVTWTRVHLLSKLKQKQQQQQLVSASSWQQLRSSRSVWSSAVLQTTLVISLKPPATKTVYWFLAYMLN